MDRALREPHRAGSLPEMSPLSYHERTKHGLDGYAKGPETLDWSMQPDPFRTYSGAKKTFLPLAANELGFRSFYGKNELIAASIESLGSLLQLSMGLSAWKEYGPDKWALRCNPSSGNLHPTECYVLALNVPGMENGLHHYVSLDHSLELRCAVSWEGETRLLFGLSSIHWREAWKYGERAFRYCQLDIGHALGALRYAAAMLGWGLGLVDSPEDVLGTRRSEDYLNAEHEEFDIFLEADLGSGINDFPLLDMQEWAGKANRIDPYPMYAWPVIEEVAHSTRRKTALPSGKRRFVQPESGDGIDAVKVILGRRSAQRFDASYAMKKDVFFSMVEKLMPENGVPWDVWGFEPRAHPVFFVHRIEGMTPGLYILPRSSARLKEKLSGEFLWEENGPLFLLAKADCRQVAKAISCRQAIASDSCFALGMLADFSEIEADPWRYRQLHWEAGLIGHVLYLEAEAQGLRGTGIGCFFDDAFHELLGISDQAFQSVYHFTVGMPMTDERITTLPPYPDRRMTWKEP